MVEDSDKFEIEENGFVLSSDSEHGDRYCADRIEQGQQETDAEHCRTLIVQTRGSGVMRLVDGNVSANRPVVPHKPPCLRSAFAPVA